MLNRKTIKIIPALVASALVLAACGKDDDSPSAAAAVSGGESILQYIPADSPYVMASLEPLPDDVMDSLEPKLDTIFTAYRKLLVAIVDAKAAEMSAEDLSGDDAERMQAFVGELSGLLSIDGMRGAGIARDSLGAVYGNGLLPVIRFELSEGELFENTLDDLEDEAGQKMLTGDIGGQSYRFFDAEEMRFVIAVVGDQAVISLVPSVFDDEQTGRALGLTLPDADITTTGVLEALIEDYDFTNHFVGYVDIAEILDTIFVREPTGLNADLMAIADHDKPALSDVCKAEMQRVAGIAPRMVIGYNDVSKNRFDSSIIVEMREDLAAELQTLTAPVPGLGGDPGGLMSFGMSLDIGETRSFIEARLDAMEADPFECELFADLQGGVAQMRQSLNQPVPPMVYDFRGFFAAIDELEGLDIATQSPPTSVDGSFVLAMNNAQALIAMGAMFSPELAALGLEPGGDPVPLDLPQLQAMGIAAYAALDDDAIGISIGEGAESQVQTVLSADTQDPSPFMSFSVDASRYYGFLGEAIGAGEMGEEDMDSEDVRMATQEMMTAVAALYDRMAADVVFTDKGVEVRMSETLKD